NADIRKSLYMPALVAYRCNAFPDFAGRLKAKGKPIKLILVALMRKLAVIAFTLLQNGQDFDKSRYQ
ncbi:IS110 family transposase, partial [Neisseria weixii]